MAGAFDLLQSPALRALLADEGFASPTAAQEAAIPVILEGKHTLLVAPTGMGKTESAVLPILDLFLRAREKVREAGAKPRRAVSILYVTPLRALNRDLMGRLDLWGRRLGVDVRVRHGDTSQSERARQAREPPDFLITTPETLQAIFMGPRLKEAIAGVRWVVVDEVHELASDERGAQLAFALERLGLLAGEFQRVGLSATVGDERDVAAWLGGAERRVSTVKVPVAKKLDLRVTSPDPTPRDHATAAKVMARPDAAAYLNTVLDLVKAHTATLVFVNTRETAEILAARARILDETFPLGVHHGSLARDARIQSEEAFKRGALRGLVCTSSMELGIDIGSADLVVQFGSPRQVTRLVQRVGRAGHRHDLVSNGVIVATEPDDIAEAAVIVDRTMREALERLPGPEAPLDVLANQLEAMALERSRVRADAAYALARRAHPFRALPREVFDETLAQLAAHRVVWSEGGDFGSLKRSRLHMVENLSMIPDARTFRIVSLVTRKAVATLDEAFVASFIEPSAAFICQGQAWRVVEIDDEKDEIRVEPVKDPLGAIPSWIGEEIPVPFEVAQEVGALREGIARDLAERGGTEAAARAADRWRVGPEAARKLVAYVAEQAGYALPTDRRVTLDVGSGRVVLNAAFGSKANETIGRILSSLVMARAGSSVGLEVDPYRVILTLPSRTPASAVREVLMETAPASVPAILELILSNSNALRQRLLHVARKFGAVQKGADWRRINMQKLVEIYRGTPLYREAIREVVEEKLDVPLAMKLLGEIQNGERELVVQGLSPIALAGMDKRADLISPARADRTLLDALKKRLENERVTLLCMNCRDWSSETRVARARDVVACPKCEGRLLAAARPWHKEALAAWKKKGRATEEERKELRRLQTAANLFLDHRERALLALVARGVGPDTAGRLLARQKPDEEPFLRDLFEAEVTYARTRQFWD
ncbi:MAG TPA: DEAD/DEAH box helicase [Candidatus Thermoplasmatota archaeon]|nr:DEAD/DEAH box helicase [Candidatus Thermoplasmatota archaeon]